MSGLFLNAARLGRVGAPGDGAPARAAMTGEVRSRGAGGRRRGPGPGPVPVGVGGGCGRVHARRRCPPVCAVAPVHLSIGARGPSRAPRRSAIDFRRPLAGAPPPSRRRVMGRAPVPAPRFKHGDGRLRHRLLVLAP